MSDPHRIVRGMKRMILQMSARAREGHIPSAFSILDILWVLYDRVMACDARNGAGSEKDWFILSKGHGSLALYAVLAERGFFPPSLIEGFAGYESPLGGHLDRNKVPGVEASTGSLGHGFPMGVGLALGLRIQRKAGRVYTLIGDGEANEGSVWEAALLASHHGLTNLCCIIDYNHSTDRHLGLGDVADKFRSFGWEARVVDGHDHEALFRAFDALSVSSPTAVIAETTKGHGCAMMENEPAWHHRFPTEEELETMLRELS
ncbi:MAG TPA: transketolase [Syntrophorhabdaceae bacterium]